MAKPPHAREAVKAAFEATLEHEPAGTFLSTPVIEGLVVQDDSPIPDLKIRRGIGWLADSV